MATNTTAKKTSGVLSFIKQVRQELVQVAWPTREKTVRLTILVVVASVMVGFYLGGLDYLFTNLIGIIIR